MTDAAATLAVPDASQAMAVLSSIPAAPASLLALASRIAALEQTLSYEAATSPPVHIALPALTPAASTNPATPTSAASAASANAASASSTSSTSSRRLTASSSLSAFPPPAAAPSLSFLSSLHELHSAMQSLEDDSTAQFFAVHAQYEQLLSSSASLSSFLHSSAAKQQILLSQYGQLTQLHSQLVQLTQLLPHITPPPLNVSVAEVEKLEKTIRERAVDVARLHVAIDRFVSMWDSCVEAINGTLLAMDSRMSKWEQQVERIEKQRQAQPV